MRKQSAFLQTQILAENSTCLTLTPNPWVITVTERVKIGVLEAEHNITLASAPPG